MLPKKLQIKLDQRNENQSFRKLSPSIDLIDFSSNDYLGFATSKTIFEQTHHYLNANNFTQNGSTGSRLLSGNHTLNQIVEQQLTEFHNAESALIFNSGYTANMGFFSCVPQRNDIILFDEYCHASIRDGIRMSDAKGHKFRHNDLVHLDDMLQQHKQDTSIYIVTESVFSMDGDAPDLNALVKLCKKHDAQLIIDEAHAIGVFGENGSGKIQELKLENDVFARIITFGKALGCHGAAILGNIVLRDFLINFSRPFIYTTALSPHSLATISIAYKELINQHKSDGSALKILRQNIIFFKAEMKRHKLQRLFIDSNSAIQSFIFSGNNNVKRISEELRQNGFDVKAILSPTVPKGQERLRFCVHSYNSTEEITKVMDLLATFVSHE